MGEGTGVGIIFSVNWSVTFMKRSTSASGKMPASFSLLASSVISSSWIQPREFQRDV